MSKVEQVRTTLAQAHVGASYYSDAESEAWLRPFWRDGGSFFPLFRQVDLSDVVELACGYGRHTAQFIDRAGHVTLVDINEDSVEACRNRFKGRSNVSFYQNNGSDLSALESDRYSAVLSYDAMVHFEASDMIAYIREIARILRPGGKALLHYSNYQGLPEGTYADEPHWRNFFSEAMFRHFASRAGLEIVSSTLLAWPADGDPNDQAKDLDAVTLSRKVA